MSGVVWQVYLVVALLLLATGAVTFMLVYRHRHKTNIETNLLLKQMRTTSRMRGLLDAQRIYIEDTDAYLREAAQDWEHVRQVAKSQGSIDIGELRRAPEPKMDFSRLLANIDRG